MGKSKTRIFRKGKNDILPKITREDAIKEVVKRLSDNNSIDAKSLITMFGLSAEELLESGASYEAIISMKNLFEG